MEMEKFLDAKKPWYLWPCLKGADGIHGNKKLFFVTLLKNMAL